MSANLRSDYVTWMYNPMLRRTLPMTCFYKLVQRGCWFIKSLNCIVSGLRVGGPFIAQGLQEKGWGFKVEAARQKAWQSIRSVV